MKNGILKIFSLKTTEEKVIWGTGIFLIFLFCLYGYFMNATVVNVVAMRNLEEQKASLLSDISQLQFQYITENTPLDIAYAEQLGFHQVKDPQFALRDRGSEFAFR